MEMHRQQHGNAPAATRKYTGSSMEMHRQQHGNAPAATRAQLHAEPATQHRRETTRCDPLPALLPT